MQRLANPMNLTNINMVLNHKVRIKSVVGVDIGIKGSGVYLIVNLQMKGKLHSGGYHWNNIVILCVPTEHQWQKIMRSWWQWHLTLLCSQSLLFCMNQSICKATGIWFNEHLWAIKDYWNTKISGVLFPRILGFCWPLSVIKGFCQTREFL